MNRGWDEDAAKKARDREWLDIEERAGRDGTAVDVQDVTVVCVEGKTHPVEVRYLKAPCADYVHRAVLITSHGETVRIVL